MARLRGEPGGLEPHELLLVALALIPEKLPKLIGYQLQALAELAEQRLSVRQIFLLPQQLQFGRKFRGLSTSEVGQRAFHRMGGQSQFFHVFSLD